MRQSAITLILMILGLLAGCKPSLGTSTAPIAEPTMAPTAVPPTTTPAWAISGSDLALREIDQGLLLIGTFENTTTSSIARIELDAQLVNEQGETVIQMPLQSVPSALIPGEEAGFAIVLPFQGGSLTPFVQISEYQQAPVNKTRVSVEILDVRTGNDGKTYVLGEIFNQSMSYARVIDLLFLPANGGDKIGAAWLIPGNQGLAPRSSVPFLASVEGMIPADGWRIFIDVAMSGIPDSPDLVLIQPITLHFTVQGLPFHILQVQNQDRLPRWIGGQLALFADETLLSLSDISSPYPLQPQEIRVISIKTYPGLPADPLSEPGGMETWRAEFQLDALRSRPALESIVALKVEVAQFETIGGLIFIRGKLSNDQEAEVTNPSVLVVARDQSGRVLDSSWVSPVEALGPGDSVSFELTLLLPAGATAEMSEYDVQGQGIIGGAE